MARVVRCLEVPEIDVVSCHAFSADLKTLALCPNNEELHIFQLVGEEFQRKHVLTKHTQRITGLSWSCEGKLVSASEDRTAFVWEWDQGLQRWHSSLVELRSSRAALCVSWSPDGKRFAAGMSSKDCAVCSWQEDVGYWIASKCGKYKAAVTSIAWHPTSQYLATGSTDRSCKVFDVGEASATFGEQQVSEDAGAWVNSVAFSESGQFLAFAPQDSTVHFKDLQLGPTAPASRVRWRGLPFLSVAFVGDSCLVACGFDKVPVLMRLDQGGSWQVAGSVDMGQKATQARGAFEMSRNAFKGGAKQESRNESAASVHTNTITACACLGGKSFSTSGSDGQVVVWELSAS